MQNTRPEITSELSPAGQDIPDSALTNTHTYVQLGAVIAVTFTVWLWWGILVQTPYTNAITQLDISQGDAALISLTTPDRHSNIHILYDAGDGRSILHALAEAPKIRNNRIDLLIMSHPHLDHYGGFVALLDRYDVGAFITNGHIAEEDMFQEMMRKLAHHNIPIIQLGEGDRIRYGEHLINILSPDARLLADNDLNEASLVAILGMGKPAGDFRILLTGDIGIPTESILIEKGYDLAADILKVGHHGSRFSSGEQFVAEVRPKVALISVGQNRFGHPAQRVLDVLSLAGTEVYRTDLDGSVTVSLETDPAHLPPADNNTETNSLLAQARSILTGSYARPNTQIISLIDLSPRTFDLVAYTACTYTTDQAPLHAPVILNEIAWMGMQSDATHEWIELRNLSDGPVDLSGWQIINENGRIHLTFPQQTTLTDTYTLVARAGAEAALGMPALAHFSGALRNSDEGVRLFDPTCTLVDEAIATPTWPAGDNSSKRTMERTALLGWTTSSAPGGTPGMANTGGGQSAPPPMSSPSARAPTTFTQIESTACTEGQINLNTAPPEALTSLRHIGAARATAIIEARPFTSVEDLARVRGLGGSRVADIVAEGRACAE